MICEEVKKTYRDVQTVLDVALEQSNSIEVCGQQENEELIGIRKNLEQLNIDFKNEIEKLENSSEWDKFCIAFFGETNAGKSTIIETLRIIYDEETRRAEAMAQKQEYCVLMEKHCQDYSGLISSLGAVNASLKKKEYREKSKWPYYVLWGVAGLVAGVLLSTLVVFFIGFLGIMLW